MASLISRTRRVLTVAKPFSQFRPSTPSNTGDFFLSSHENPMSSSHTFARSIVSHGRNPTFPIPNFVRLARFSESESSTVPYRCQIPDLNRTNIVRLTRFSNSESPYCCRMSFLNRTNENLEPVEELQSIEEMKKNINGLLISLTVMSLFHFGITRIELVPGTPLEVRLPSVMAFANPFVSAFMLCLHKSQIFLGRNSYDRLVTFTTNASMFAFQIVKLSLPLGLFHVGLGAWIAYTGLTTPLLTAQSILAVVYQFLLYTQMLRMPPSLNLRHLAMKLDSLHSLPWTAVRHDLKALNRLIVGFHMAAALAAALSATLFLGFWVYDDSNSFLL